MADGSSDGGAPRRRLRWFGRGREQAIPDGSVFISYRRGDSAGHTGRLYDRLTAAFGDAAIFMDIDAIDPGVDFAQRIREALATCRIVLVVIGPRWLDASDDDGGRRLDDPQDYLRMEIAASLQRESALVIPILVAGGAMPNREQLPEPLAPLAQRQAIELSDPRWNFDVTRLEGVITRAMARRADLRTQDQPPRTQGRSGAPPPTGELPVERDDWDAWNGGPRRRLGSGILAIVLVLLFSGGGWWLYQNLSAMPPGAEAAGQSESASPTPSPAPTTAAPPPSTAPPSDQPSEPPRPDVAFIRNGELWGVDADGSNRHPFWDPPRPVQHPDWAVDGRIVFSSNRDDGDFQVGDTEIWVVDADGENLTQLTNNRINDAAPDWSPDGSRIAYSSSPDDRLRDIVVMNDDGTNPVNLTNTVNEDDDTPDWSPDGEEIVWEREVEGQHDIWRMDKSGDNPTAVTATPEADDYWPAWSPDGERIAFRSNILASGPREYDVFTVAVDIGSAAADGYTQITTDGANNHRPAWSPDGEWIAFDKARDFADAQAARDNVAIDNDRDVWIKPIAGGMSERLTNRTGTNIAPVWDPRG